MITFHRPESASTPCRDLSNCATLTDTSNWIDLLRPTREEEEAVESALGIDVPTKDEMQDIATSSRLYQEEGSLFMTATILTKADTSRPESSAVTFILTPKRLITVRYAEPLAFTNFTNRHDAKPAAYDSPVRVLQGLTDAVIERLADILENVGAGLEELSLAVFTPPKNRNEARDFKEMLSRVGRFSDLAAKARESLLSLSRLFWFYQEVDKSQLVDEGELAATLAQIKTATRDIAALSDHSTFLAGKVAFLLDAILGLINVEQNAIIKIFSVAAVVFLPPTLVASIYGMNFEHMPELGWTFGYPFAIGLMIVSAVLPFYFFKRQGWL